MYNFADWFGDHFLIYYEGQKYQIKMLINKRSFDHHEKVGEFKQKELLLEIGEEKRIENTIIGRVVS